MRLVGQVFVEVYPLAPSPLPTQQDTPGGALGPTSPCQAGLFFVWLCHAAYGILVP